MFKNFFFSKNHAVYKITSEKYRWAGQATDDNVTRASEHN
jgi:hypothetical protein